MKSNIPIQCCAPGRSICGGSREKQNIPIGILPGGGITLTGPVTIGIPIGILLGGITLTGDITIGIPISIIPGGGITLTGDITIGIPIGISIPDGGRGVFSQR